MQILNIVDEFLLWLLPFTRQQKIRGEKLIIDHVYETTLIVGSYSCYFFICCSAELATYNLQFHHQIYTLCRSTGETNLILTYCFYFSIWWLVSYIVGHHGCNSVMHCQRLTNSEIEKYEIISYGRYVILTKWNKKVKILTKYIYLKVEPCTKFRNIKN